MRDKRLIFFNKIRGLDDTSYLKYSLKYQLAPVIMGFKPSMTINLPSDKYEKDWDVYNQFIEKDLGVKSMILRKSERSMIILFYRPCLIECLLEEKEIRDFLEPFGYNVTSVERAILHLKERYQKEHCPHELGVFLGIALEDVKDYMLYPEKECLMCSYWKVYNNLEVAQTKFAQYDLAKVKMLNALLEELEIAS